MVNNKTKMNKFLTSALTATMVASAIAPMASAASFTDLDKVGEDVKKEIDRAVDLGYFKIGDKFNPSVSINRSQAALTLARHLAGGSTLQDLIDYVVAEDIEAKVTAFDDVGMDFKNGADYQKELYYASLIVKNAGAFTQANLNPAGKVTRSQMAKIITGTFGLEKLEGFQSEITDISHLDTETRKYIETIASHGVTNVKKFNPAGTVTRSQMASFLVRAYDAVAEETKEVYSVHALNTTVDLSGTLTFSVNGEKEAANLENLKELGYTVEFQASKNVFADSDAVSTDKKGTTSKTGKLSKEKTTAGDQFEYNVIIKKDNEVVAEFAKRQLVTVEDYAKTAVSIDEVKTFTADQEVKDGRLGLNDTIKLNIKGKVKDNSNLVNFEVVGTDAPAVVEVDRPAILEFDQATGQLTAKAKGSAIVTITVGEQTTTVNYVVGDERKATTAAIDKKSLNLATNQTEVVTAKITDQYGLGFAGTDVAADNADTNNKVITKKVQGVASTKEAGLYTFNLKAVNEKAAGSILVKVGDIELGTIAVDVKVAQDEIESYKLIAENTVFDLKNETGKADKKVVLKGYDEQGFEVPGTKQPVLGSGYKLVSKNTDVATVDQNKVKLSKNAKAGDKVIIGAFKVTGAFEDKVAELEFTVVDSSPKIDDITITSAESVQTDLAVDFTKLVTVTASNIDGSVDVKYVVSEDKKGLEIVEADTTAPKVLGIVRFSSSVTLEVDTDGKIVFNEDVKDKEITASYIVDQAFKGQVKLKFELE